MAAKVVTELAAALGLERQTETGTFYGELEGFPAQISLVPRGNTRQLVAVLRYNADGRAEELAHALGESADLAAAGVGRKQMASDADSLVLTIPMRPFLGFPKAGVSTARVRAALDVLRRSVPDNRKVCRECGAAGAEPAILRGRIDRVCSACVERLEQQEREVEQAYASRPLNLPLGLLSSLVAGAAGAALYGGVMVATNSMYWVLAILTGIAVGWAAVKGAGKGGPLVQAMAALVTVASVLAGLLVFIGWLVNKHAVEQGNTVDWTRFAAAAPRLLWASGTDALFSLAGGLFGAYSAIKRAGRPGFALVEKARS
ncbi:MAG TPA: hypothetical protein VLW85_09275 [Myxococcales bacterium]|nr:hypothetical protein [Myxococcales bacterium]